MITQVISPVHPSNHMASKAEAYLESSGLVKELADCVSQVVREKAPNALARLSELLAAKVGTRARGARPTNSNPNPNPNQVGKPGPPPLCDYLDTVGNTPMVKLGKCLPEGVKAAALPPPSPPHQSLIQTTITTPTTTPPPPPPHLQGGARSRQARDVQPGRLAQRRHRTTHDRDGRERGAASFASHASLQEPYP